MSVLAADFKHQSYVCAFTLVFNFVLIVDTTPPDINNCPTESITRLIELGTQGVIVTWMEITASDISGTAVLSSRTNQPGSFFMPGTTEVTYIFADASNNIAICNFTIIVIEGRYNPHSIKKFVLYSLTVLVRAFIKFFLPGVLIPMHAFVFVRSQSKNWGSWCSD